MGRGLAAGLSLEKTLKYFTCWWSTLFKPQLSSHRSFSRSQTVIAKLRAKMREEWEGNRVSISFMSLSQFHFSACVDPLWPALCVNLQRLWNAKRRLRLWVVVKMWWGFCLKAASFFVWIKLALLSVPGEVKDLQLQLLRDRPSISSWIHNNLPL